MNLIKAFRLIFSITLSVLVLMGCSKKNSAEDSNKVEPATKTPAKPGEKAAAPSVAEPVLIEPGAGIGKVRRGMTTNEILNAVGKPDSARGNFWTYQREGLALGISKEGTIFNIHCRSGFKGRTQEGLGIGFTAEEIRKAYGEPSSKKSVNGSDIMHYTMPQIRFFLKDGKVYQMVLDLPKQG